MRKTCAKCKQSLSINEFNKKQKSVSGEILYQPYCRECNKIASRKYYQDNKKKHIADIKRRSAIRCKQIQNNLLEYLKMHSCVDCNTTDVRVLQFDHVRGTKLNDVSTMIQQGYSWNSILNEIEKCDVRCANCHTIKTAERLGSFRSKWK